MKIVVSCQFLLSKISFYIHINQIHFSYLTINFVLIFNPVFNSKL